MMNIRSVDKENKHEKMGWRWGVWCIFCLKGNFCSCTSHQSSSFMICPCLQHVDIPRPGIEPTPQQQPELLP